jgi:pyruvate ferredoxin oxidoreductase gamma subunit
VFGGLDGHGFVVLNTARTLAELGLAELSDGLPAGHVRTVAASELAREHLGRPMPGAPLLGALAELTGVVTAESLAAAIRERFPGRLGEANAAAAEAARLTVSEAIHA